MPPSSVFLRYNSETRTTAAVLPPLSFLGSLKEDMKAGRVCGPLIGPQLRLSRRVVPVLFPDCSQQRRGITAARKGTLRPAGKDIYGAIASPSENCTREGVLGDIRTPKTMVRLHRPEIRS